MVLWRLDPDRARPVHWWSEAGSVAQRASLRRRAIETIDGLASRDRTMTLVADLEFGGPPTWDFLTALGWDAVLRCTADEPVALPGLPPQPLARLVPPDAELHEAHVVLLPRLDIHARRLVMTRTEGALQGLISDWTGPPGGRLAALSSTGAGVSDALDPLVAPERRLSVTSDQWMPWLTLWLMTHELLALLGEASDETAASGDHMRHGLHLFTSLPAMTDDQAQSWLRAVARRLGTEPARMIWPSRPTTDSAG
ncbi:MAG: hypothetical protein EOO75_12705 [Myxococcales bacterium]|nr:MAG: hypothetical protein EOO75_12705 [Myxococcales bacterium]